MYVMSIATKCSWDFHYMTVCFPRKLNNKWDVDAGGTEMDGVQPDRCHVLTYEDEEGDLVMVGDVPWE